MYSSRSSRLQSLGHTEARQSQGCPNFLSFRSPLTFFASIFNTFLGILSYDIIAYYHMISYASLHYLLSALSDAVWKHQTWHSFASKVWHGAGPTLALGDLVVTKRHGKEGGIFRLDPDAGCHFQESRGVQGRAQIPRETETDEVDLFSSLISIHLNSTIVINSSDNSYSN